MMRKSLSICAAVALPALFTAAASAATLNYEGFNYTENSLLSGQSGGSGWGGAWGISYDDVTHPGTGTVITPNATYTGLSTEGLRVRVKGGDTAGSGVGGSSLTRSLGATYGTQGTTVWFSFIGRLNSWLGNNNVEAGLAFTNGGAQVLALGQGNGAANSHWAVAGTLGNSTQTQITTSTDNGVDHLFVGQITFGASNASVNVWADPTLGGATPGGTSVNFVTAAPISFDGLILRDSMADAVPQFDEIRIGTDFASVQSNVGGTAVPEPASLSLLALGGLALARRRRQ
jgi:hypothetical protein